MGVVGLPFTFDVPLNDLSSPTSSSGLRRRAAGSLWMLSYIDPSLLGRLISGDVLDLKSMQPHVTVDVIIVSIIGAAALVSAAFPTNAEWSCQRNWTREGRGEGRRMMNKARGRRPEGDSTNICSS